jgi:hypothetical protein
MQTRFPCAILTLMAALVLLATLRSSEGAEPEATPPAMEMRTYNIRDILHRATLTEPSAFNFRNNMMVCGTGSSGSGGIFTDTSGRSREDVIKELADTIKTTITPESWVDGGGQASLREFEGHLMIRQTPEAHAVVKKLLTQLREAGQLQVQVELRIFSVDQKTLETLSAETPTITAKQAAPLLTPAAGAKVKLISAPRTIVYSGSASSEVSRLAENTYVQFVKQSTEHAPDPAALTGNTGNVISTAPGNEKPKANRNLTTEPVMANAFNATVFRTNATVADDRGSVIVHLSQGTARTTLTPQDLAMGTDKAVAAQAAVQDRTGIDATVTIPTGHYAVLGGDRIENAQSVAGEEPTFLLYLVRATIIPPPAAGPITPSAKP